MNVKELFSHIAVHFPWMIVGFCSFGLAIGALGLWLSPSLNICFDHLGNGAPSYIIQYLLSGFVTLISISIIIAMPLFQLTVSRIEKGRPDININ